LFKGIEHFWQEFRFDSDTDIGNFDDNAIFRGIARMHCYGIMGSAKFCCILENIPENLLQPYRVTKDLMLASFQCDGEL
jgi:hypothetical protein